MTLELARRLRDAERIDPSLLEASLMAAVRDRTSLIRVLLERVTGAVTLLERFLLRHELPRVTRVEPLSELVQLLPEGLCWSLLAVPIRRDLGTGCVDVAVADPWDAHLAPEFAFHLGAPVALVQAPLLEMLAALERGPFVPSDFPRAALPGDFVDDRSPRTDFPENTAEASSSRLPRDPESPSQFPIPLVRRPFIPHFDSGTRPGVGGPSKPKGELSSDENGEPVLPLSRAKSSTRPVDSRPADSRPTDEEHYLSLLASLEEVSDPNEVIEIVLEGLRSVANRIIVFTSQGGIHQVRASSFPMAVSEPLRSAGLESSPDCVIDRSIREGQFYGRIPATSANRPLLQLLGTQSGDIYVMPVNVSGKPVLAVILGSLKLPSLAGRRVERMSRTAGQALERIVRSKKTPR